MTVSPSRPSHDRAAGRAGDRARKTSVRWVACTVAFRLASRTWPRPGGAPAVAAPGAAILAVAGRNATGTRPPRPVRPSPATHVKGSPPMSSDSTPVSSSDRLRFDEPAPGPGTPACARCQAPITAAYYEVNGHVVCSGCKAALERAPAGSSASRMLRATAFGLGGAVLGAGIYYAILAATGYEIGLVAILVGWLVGRAVQKGSNGAGGWAYQTLAVGLTYLAIVSTYVPFIFKSATENGPKSTAAAVAPAATDSVTVLPVAATADTTAHRMTVGRFALGLVALVAIAAVAPFL